MPIMEDILTTLRKDAPITEVRIGPFWTAVRSENCGLASSQFVHEHSRGAPVPDAGGLTHKTAKELASGYDSVSDLERCLALASVNSIIDIDLNRCVSVNASKVLMERGKGKAVAVVGHFPFVDGLRRVSEELWVIEKRPKEGDEQSNRAPDLIPQADVVAITGTALLNGTMDDLLSYCKPDAFILVLGPTTPMSPVWFDYRVNMVSGTVVERPDDVMRCVSEGAIFKQLVDHCNLLTMTR